MKNILSRIAAKFGYIPKVDINIWDKRKGNLRRFQYSASDKEWKQLMMYVEMMHKLKDIPGDIAEFGVASGVSLISFIRIIRALEPGDKRDQRKIYGFDSFEGLPELTEKDQTRIAVEKTVEMKKGGYDHPQSYPDLFRFVESDANTELIKGWFDKTVPEFFNKNPHVSLAFVHLDADLYDSTLVVLENTWERLVPGGIILFDELNIPNFPGETEAYTDFFKDKEGKYTLHSTRALPRKRYLIKK